VTVQQGWPTGTQQILIPSTWQQMPGMSIHNQGQAVVTDSLGAPVSDSQQAPGWRWVQPNNSSWISSKGGLSFTWKCQLLFSGVIMAASMIAPASRNVASAVTLPHKTTTQGPLIEDPNWAKERRLDILRTEQGISSGFHTVTFYYECLIII